MHAASAQKILRRHDRSLLVLRGLQPRAVRRLRRGLSVPGWLREPFYMIWRRSPKTGAMRHLRTIHDANGHARPIEEADVHDLLYKAKQLDRVLLGKSGAELHDNNWHEFERLVGDDAEDVKVARAEKLAVDRRKFYRDRMKFALRRDAHQIVRSASLRQRSVTK
jgi:hypothetical protein